MLLKHLLKTFATAFLFVLALSSVSAQEGAAPLFGIYCGVNTNQVYGIYYMVVPYNPNQQEPSPVVDRTIPFFENYSPSLGIFVNYPLSSSMLLSGRLGYNNIKGNIDVGIGGLNDTSYSGNLNFTSHNIEFSPNVLFNNFLLKDLYFLAGGELGIPVSDSYNLTERITA
ncbi:MAG: hypothetical protein V4642_05860, partial [Bacteroidota bacterium]